MFLDYFVFALGSGLGGMFRYALYVEPTLGPYQDGMYLSTVLVNAIGSFVAGGAVGLSLRNGAQIPIMFMIGFAGGVTAYSAYSLEALYLLQHGDVLSSLFYTVMSTVLYVVAAMAGFMIIEMVG